jgi:hypothetical protein
MYEHRTEPLLPPQQFVRRMLEHLAIALGLIAVSLGIGACGYRSTEGMGWLDAVLNASMILAGMGPVDVLHTTAGKLFASGYALFSGVAFLVTVGIVIAPLAHRLLHVLHLETRED